MRNRTKAIIIILLLIILFLSGRLQAQVPKIDSVYPLKGSIGSLMTIKGNKMNYSKTVNIGNTSELIISENDSQVVVMIMPGTQTDYIKIVSFSNGQSIYADNFVVVASTPPIKQLGNKLFDSTVTTDPQEGTSVAISADGNTAVVGGQNGNNNVGAVWIYVRTNNVWIQQGNSLSGSGAIGSSYQGYSVAISADGNTIIEGGIGDNGFTGAAWIFIRDENNVWSQQGNKLVGSGSIVVQGTTPEQGYAVCISADGNTAIIGGRRDSNYIGAAWIFTRNNSIWAEQQKLVGSDHISIAYHQGFPTYLGVDMGTSVAMSADGNTALIGGPRDNNDTGAVWVFTRSGNVWAQQNKLVGLGGNRSFLGGIQQGTSCAISGDGNTAIIGAPFDLDSSTANNTDNYYNGAVWIFTRSNNLWLQQGNKLFAADAGLGAQQGWSVSLSADGNTAIVGAPTDSGYVGGSWVYTHNANGWIQASNKLLGTGYLGGPKQGSSVNISADGNTAIIGGPENSPLGASWVFADTSKSVLAVSFLNFKAYLFNKGTQTTWAGFNEINLSSYDVERSNSNFNFIKLANVAAKTKTAFENNYAWFDTSPFAGNNFYRIKAINKDGSVQYSSIVKVNISNTQSSIQVYPNPAMDKTVHLHLVNISAGNYILSVYNASGKTLYRQGFQHASGTASIAINLKNAAAGMYKIEMKNSSNNYQTSVIMQ